MRNPLFKGVRAFMRIRSESRTRERHGKGRWPAAAIAIVIGCGCAPAAQRGDLPPGSRAHTGAPALSAEQCVANAEIERAAAADDRYVIQPGDNLAIDFYLSPEFNEQVTVRPDGRVTLRMVGDMQAAGLTPAALGNQIDHDYLTELKSPEAVVHVTNMPGRQIYVQGQVTKPGAFPLDSGMTALAAISEAGGVTKDANDTVVLIRRDACGIPHAIKLNLAAATEHPDGQEDAALMPHDILVVPRSTIANMDLWVDHYIRGLLPVQPYLGMTPPL
jgi:polysaccharide export outer membrane protein